MMLNIAMKGSDEQFTAQRTDPELQFLDTKLNTLGKGVQIQSKKSPLRKKFRKISLASKTSLATKESCNEEIVQTNRYSHLPYDQMMTKIERVEVIAPWELLRRSRKKKIKENTVELFKEGLKQKSRFKQSPSKSRKGSIASVKAVHFHDSTPKNLKSSALKNKSKFLKFKEEEGSSTF
jgi:hypothetical protein